MTTRQRGCLGVANGVWIFRSNGAGRKTRREPSCVDLVRRSVWCGTAEIFALRHGARLTDSCAHRTLRFGPRRRTLHERAARRDPFAARTPKARWQLVGSNVRPCTAWKFSLTFAALKAVVRVRSVAFNVAATKSFQNPACSDVRLYLPSTQLSVNSRRTSSKV